jgi:hypothetical protein
VRLRGRFFCGTDDVRTEIPGEAFGGRGAPGIAEATASGSKRRPGMSGFPKHK